MMGIPARLILTACVFYCGLTSVELYNQMTDQVVTSKVNERGRILENFRNLYDSIARHDEMKSGVYHENLKQEIVKEQQAFDAMKEEIWIARSRNDLKKRNYFIMSNMNENVVARKRETDENKRIADDYKTLNFSAVLPIDETTQKLVAGGIQNETAHLFKRIKHLVNTNNSSMDKVESIKFNMADITFNYIVTGHIRENFEYPYPGTTLMEVNYTLPMNASITADVIARVSLPSHGSQ